MTIIHSADFAREGGKLSGAVAIAGLDRLHDRLAKRAGEAKWSLVGGVDKLERPFLRLKVEAVVELLCQRCLKPMPFEVVADTVLTQFADEAALDEAVEQDEDLEGILIEPALDVEMLVEDEVLLALPESPSPLLTRALFYTGITRAKHKVEIWGLPARLAEAVNTKAERAAGLAQLLYAGPMAPALDAAQLDLF